MAKESPVAAAAPAAPVQGKVVEPAQHSGESNAGKWDGWYKDLQVSDAGSRYGGVLSYLMAGAFLADCKEVEDWGCGRGGFRPYCTGRYIGVDGSHTPYADKVVELATYRGSADGVLLRHVLEHNYHWPEILTAAVQSFKRKLCVVIFTPFADTTRELAYNKIGVPDLALAAEDVEAHFKGLKWKLFRDLVSKTQYGVEHVYYVWREPEPLSFWQRLKAVFTG